MTHEDCDVKSYKSIEPHAGFRAFFDDVACCENEVRTLGVFDYDVRTLGVF